MPCRDYEDDNQYYQQQNDRLARISCKVLRAFEKSDPKALEKFLKKDTETREWWKKHKAADAAEQARKEEERKKKELKKSALTKLSEEERKALDL